MPSFSKMIVPHSKFYIAAFTKQPAAPYLLFIHGGPGLNSGVVEYLIEHDQFYKLLDFNIILYDQRSCGRSIKFFDLQMKVSHEDNISDIREIFEDLTKTFAMNIKGLIGHSYGAKLLFDFLKSSQLNIPAIFVSTANSILTPRLNNLILDLTYLKKTNPERYKETVNKMHNMDFVKIWKLTEALAPLFNENKDRPYFYWANLDIFERVQKIQALINLPINNDVFMSVREYLYMHEENSPIDIDSLESSHLWINGFQDTVMGEPTRGLEKKSSITLFSKSSHYPHLEENEKFCESVNVFIKSL